MLSISWSPLGSSLPPEKQSPETLLSTPSADARVREGVNYETDGPLGIVSTDCLAPPCQGFLEGLRTSWTSALPSRGLSAALLGS